MKATENEYRAHMSALYRMAKSRDWDFTRMCVLLAKMESVWVARKRFHAAETPESEALARWTLNDRRSDLMCLMSAWCLTEGQKDNILWLVQNTE